MRELRLDLLNLDSWSFIWRPRDVFLGETKQRNCTPARNNRHTGDAPSNQPVVAGVSPKNVWYFEVNLTLSKGSTSEG